MVTPSNRTDARTGSPAGMASVRQIACALGAHGFPLAAWLNGTSVDTSGDLIKPESGLAEMDYESLPWGSEKLPGLDKAKRDWLQSAQYGTLKRSFEHPGGNAHGSSYPC